tara:strand:+ start:245 stop:631 length:387 start_codon:yes stop_codon:yes gene_type:complete
MDELKLREIFTLLLKDHDLDKFLEHCTDDIKFIIHPKHVAAGIYDRKSIYDLFVHLEKSFPNWSERIDQVYHDKDKKTYIVVFTGNSSTIQDIWNVQFIFYNDEGKIFKIEERIDTLHLAEGNIGPRI